MANKTLAVLVIVDSPWNDEEDPEEFFKKALNHYRGCGCCGSDASFDIISVQELKGIHERIREAAKQAFKVHSPDEPTT